MRKLLFAVLIVPFIFSCTNVGTSTGNGDTETLDSASIYDVMNNKSEAKLYFDSLVNKYPNYKENSIAQESIVKEIDEYLTPYEGKQFNIFKDFLVEFSRILRVNGDKATVEFRNLTSTGGNGSDWLLSYSVEFETSKEEASKFASKDLYYVTGKLKKWNKYSLGVTYSIDLGTFVMEDVQLKKF